MLGARDVGGDLYVRQFLVDFGPLGVGVGNELAVLDDFSGQSKVQVLRLELDVLVGLVHGEDDTIVTDLHFLNVSDASGLAGCKFVGLDLARSIGNVDRALAHAGAESLETTASAAGLNNRCLEVRESFGEAFSNDLCVRQNVEEPATWIWSRAEAAPAKATEATRAAADNLKTFIMTLPSWGPCSGFRELRRQEARPFKSVWAVPAASS